MRGFLRIRITGIGEPDGQHLVSIHDLNVKAFAVAGRVVPGTRVEMRTEIIAYGRPGEKQGDDKSENLVKVNMLLGEFCRAPFLLFIMYWFP